MSALSTTDAPAAGHAFGAATSKAASRRSVRDALLLMDGSDADERLVKVADCVAATFDTHLEAALLNEIPIPNIFANDVNVDSIYSFREFDAQAIERLAKERTERLERTGQRFEFRRIEALSFEMEIVVSHMARTVDLVVVARPYDGTARRPELLEAILFEGGTPTLVVPPMASAMDPKAPVVIGWKNTLECARAVTGALPFLQRAASVHLVSIEEHDAEESSGREPMADMARHIARHGVDVEIRHLPRWDHPAQALLHEAGVIGAGLLVTGAYGRSRLREWILGGVTRELLQETQLPTLLAH
ncbi:universal stress protein [Aureimonas sp. Leaf324]|jgi:nucleotide-binding universal stress UspA family protein|uniref:universal stress protein n=1 Tax=Aureimonas sp. Leaf324 TaxID=1736336 RepID=UPI0006F204C0|nr:universal stress protein [Aureimonas sp. Leaf324]KQQ85725.1 hypothetical protein ASF65_04030 [Aureimonas sp. Leaf324]